MAERPKLLTVGDLSNYLRVHRTTVYRLLRKGELPAFKIGSDWRFNAEAIEEWQARHSASAGHEDQN